MSRVTAIISALVICIIVCPSRAVNHYRDNAITYKAQRDKKCQRTGSWRTRQLLTCRCVSVTALDAKYTKELADAKAENDALRDDVAAGRRVGCTSKQSVSRQCVKPPPPPAEQCSLPRLGVETGLNGIISPSERVLITMQSNLRLNWAGGVNEQVDIVIPGWATHALRGAIHSAQRSINA